MSEMRAQSMHEVFGWTETPFSKSNGRVEEKCNNSQIASQKRAMAIDALRHRPTREDVLREINSKNNPQGLM